MTGWHHSRASSRNLKPRNLWGFSTVVVMSTLLAGCGSVAFEGAVFDAVGLSEKAQAAAKEEKQLKPRTGLVMPPSTDRLPQPGSAPQASDVAASDPLFPIDQEDVQRRQVAAKEAEHKAFCEKALREARALGQDDIIEGPLGQCNPSIVNIWKNQSGSGQSTGG